VGMKSHIPVISIIIPVWNAEPYLRRCLDSVVNQTLHDIEIICVNDASTDNSLSILNEYAAKDSRMRVVSLEKRSGESVARNTGLSMVQGEYIGSVDSDDAVDFDFYEKLYVKAQETRADIVKGNRLQTEYNGTTRELNINDEVRKDKIYFSWQWWTAIYKNTLIIENNINFPPELILNGDIVFLTKAVICAKNVETVDTVFYNYYRHENSVNSKILTVEKTISYIDSVKLIIDYINTIDMKNITREQYNYVFSENLIRCVMTFFRPVYWSGSEKETKKYCAEAVLKLYTKCKYHELLNERLAAEYPAWHKFFLSDDAVGLTDFLINNTYEKVIATNLRARLLAGSTLTLLERKPGLPAREARCAKPA
jgi:glycosyltransferase involved in cell wall biosynthesis